MGNRLTLPLLFLAVLLAGGAFFWMTGDERRGGPALEEEPRAASDEPREVADLVAPTKPAEEAIPSAAPQRVELAETASEPAPSAHRHDEVGLSGRVVDRFDAPIAGARVIAAADTGFPLDLELGRDIPWLKRMRTETDADGAFRLEGVEPGSLQIAIRAPGFAPFQKRGVLVPKADTELEPLVLARGAILSGLVVDSQGRPVEGAHIVRDEIAEGGGLFMLGEREPTAVTGPDGRFRVEELACGAWRFVVRSEEHPNKGFEGLAEDPGVEVGDLRWQLEPGETLHGSVTAIPEGERDHLEVRAMRGAGVDGLFGFGESRIGKVESNGSFLLRGLVPGETYTLQARRVRSGDEHGFWERSRSNSVQARSGDRNVVLTYQPEAALVFRVFDGATRAPLEEFQVESGVDWPQPLRDDDGRTRTRFPGGEVRVGGLRPSSDLERVRLKLRATGYSDFERSDIAVRAGQEIDLGSIFLDPVPLVRVRVTDRATGSPIANASVRMQKQQGDGFSISRSISIDEDEGQNSIEIGESRSGKTDSDGWAELTSFEGDTVDILARAEGYAEGRLSGLVLSTGKPHEAQLELTQGGDVLVRVLDAQGLPSKGARVEHRSGSGNELPGGLMVMGAGTGMGGEVSDSAGEVLFENLAGGVHSFRIGEGGGGGAMFTHDEAFVIAGMGDDEGDEWTQIQVVEGERVELTLRAAPRGELTGRVREAGKVLPGATLRLVKNSPDGGTRPGMLRMPGMGGGGPEARSDGDGRFLFSDVKEGDYKLTVEHPTRRMPEEFPLEVREGENSYDVDLSLSILSGQIRDEEGQPLAGVRVRPERKSPSGGGAMGMRMIMIADDGGGGGMIDSGQFGETAMTDSEGRYTLRGVTSDVDLVVKAEGDTVQPGESDVVRLAPNEVKDGVDLRLEAAGSILVEAHLSDGAPARFQIVQAEFLGQADSPVPPKFGFLQQGSTELKGLKPGRWKVNVRDAQGGPMNQESGQDKEIEVKPQETVKATFEVN